MSATEEPQTGNTEALNALLRGEIAAVETYTYALTKFDDERVIAELQKIRDEHCRAVRELRDQVVQCGGNPLEGAEPWGEFVSAMSGTRPMAGPATALATLRLGEEHEASEYESALENTAVPPESQRTIRVDLLAACRRHIEELDRLLGGMSC